MFAKSRGGFASPGHSSIGRLMTSSLGPFPGAIPLAVQALPSTDSGLRLAWRSLLDLWYSMIARTPHTAAALLVIVAFWVLGRGVGRVVRMTARRARLERELVELFGNTASVLVSVLGVLVGFVVVFPGFAPGDLVAGLGLTSVAVGFAFKDILQNFFAGIFILWRRPFHIGDQIRTTEYEGTVEEITMRSTRLKTYDGERVILPNADVYTHAVEVRTAYAVRRIRFVVGIAYPESIEEAREVIYRTLAETEGVLVNPGPWVYVTELGDFSVNFTVYFWTGSEQANVLRVSDRVATRIKLALDEAGIEIPYPRTVVFLRGGGTDEGEAPSA
jgi:small conductance mechanosensitive channel